MTSGTVEEGARKVNSGIVGGVVIGDARRQISKVVLPPWESILYPFETTLTRSAPFTPVADLNAMNLCKCSEL